MIQKSSNVGTVKIAMQMQPRDMWEMYTKVGFGQKPDVPFPGAVSGRLRAYKTWKPIEQATMSYGYGLSASLFQLAHAYTVFARDGDLVPVTMLKSPERVAGVPVMSAANASAMRNMLHMVAGPGGTAPLAQTMGYSVGGKTGTAHKQEGRGYADKKYRGFFVGIAPIENPRIVVAVIIDEPNNGKYFGGLVAAPVFSDTVQQTLRMLGVQPDMSVKPQIVAEAVRGELLMRQLHTPSEAAQWLHSRVTGSLQTDSRQVQPGDGFIAWPGAATDARQHVAGALARGAAACLVEHEGVSSFKFEDERVASFGQLKAASGPIAADYFGQPSDRLKVLAVTGTNGKTSVAWWLAQALSNLKQSALMPCGLVGTLGIGRPPQPGRSAVDARRRGTGAVEHRHDDARPRVAAVPLQPVFERWRASLCH